MNVYSGAGPKPRIGPLPINRGLMYKDPFPEGGTWPKTTPLRSQKKETYSEDDICYVKAGFTQRLFAKAVCLTASTN